MLEKHRGQKDKAGKPYYGHLIRVAQDVFTGKRKIVALLHDIVEDTDATPEFLLQQGFPSEIVEAVEAISHREDESYEAFINRVAQNPLATTVKISDLEDNMDIFRLKEITEEDRLRLNKYLKAWRQLVELEG
ncbi:MAG: GTP pyrophosphokinase [Bacteroidaceae bacterium]|nr:GTP pyrophosphokinase [Bacteroidaceae bacterium]